MRVPSPQLPLRHRPGLCLKLLPPSERPPREPPAPGPPGTVLGRNLSPAAAVSQPAGTAGRGRPCRRGRRLLPGEPAPAAMPGVSASSSLAGRRVTPVPLPEGDGECGSAETTALPSPARFIPEGIGGPVGWDRGKRLRFARCFLCVERFRLFSYIKLPREVVWFSQAVDLKFHSENRALMSWVDPGIKYWNTRLEGTAGIIIQTFLAKAWSRQDGPAACPAES